MLNKVSLIGRVGRDVEARVSATGITSAKVNLATTHKYKNRDGELQEQTEWHQIVIYGKLAEIAGKYLQKGALVYFEGRIQTRKWEKDGQTRYTTEVIATEMKFLSKKGDDHAHADRPAGSNAPVDADDDSSEVPF